MLGVMVGNWISQRGVCCAGIVAVKMGLDQSFNKV